MNDGLLGTHAPLSADIVLLLEIAMGAALLVGAWQARAKRYREHAWCQSLVVLLNLAAITGTMVPSFRMQVLPRIPAKLSRAYFALATGHATLGSITELAALYILLAAGTRLLPEGLRLKRYKLWMRTVLALWWLVLLLGFATYLRWYVPKIFSLDFRVRKKAEGSTIASRSGWHSSSPFLYLTDSTYVTRSP